MAGIGEASAVIAVVQVGFSLATALNTYIADVSDARDDISSLASDIEATFGQLRDLGKLIKKNETAKAWSEDGSRNAQKCVTDCEKTIAKLRKLLKKSTASATSDEVSRDEIDVTKLERTLWPFIKPQLEVRRRELQSIKQDIMIAYSSYMTQVGCASSILHADINANKLEEPTPNARNTRMTYRDFRRLVDWSTGKFARLRSNAEGKCLLAKEGCNLDHQCRYYPVACRTAMLGSTTAAESAIQFMLQETILMMMGRVQCLVMTSLLCLTT